MTKKYDISFGIYDIEAQDWITEDEEHRIEFTGHIRDFDGLSTKIIQIIEEHEEEKIELELEEDPESDANKIEESKELEN